jgi:GNAT superfamily N-acetyltransferase
MIVELAPGHIGPAVESLIPHDVPARPRALAVLDGLLTGAAWADDPADPSWVVVIETADGSVYAGGELTAPLLARVLGGVETASGDLVFGFRGAGDPIRRLLPPNAYHTGEAIDFTDRVAPSDEGDELGPPPGMRVERIGPDLLPRTEWYEDTLFAFGSAERFAELGIGYGLVDGDVLVAECTTGPRTRGSYEMGVVTREALRGRGFGTLVSRHVARACEATGATVWWNASAANPPSVAIARRLGFRTERRYELVAYRTSEWTS